MWYIHTMEYYSTIERNEVLTHATMWMELENIMLSETRQLQKAGRSKAENMNVSKKQWAIDLAICHLHKALKHLPWDLTSN